ncbi:hypothetical protein [Streptosporangium sp. NPDC000509]|uniref:hypothetical protein n=1 Tax=Streptosporangium sp. NPDC000509 TaxID=3366186 RepID=UPI0036960EBD
MPEASSIAWSRLGEDRLSGRMIADRLVLVAATLGVGSREATSAARHSPCVLASCDGERLVCRFSRSDALGVGSSETV